MPGMTVGERPDIYLRWKAQAFSHNRLMSFGYRETNKTNNKINTFNCLRNTAGDYIDIFKSV